MPIWLRKIIVCWWGGCGMVPRDDDTGCWGECLRCGKRAGFVDRATLRAYCEAEYRRSLGGGALRRRDIESA